MKVGYAVLYEDGTLTISKEHTILPKPILKDYDKFEDGLRPWLLSSEKIKTVRILNQVKPFTVYGWFYHCKNLTTLIDFQNLDVSDCEDFSYVFHGCELLTDISSLKNWNVSNGKNFQSMFECCKKILDVSALANWSVSNGEDFTNMFKSCKSLININMKNWKMSNGQYFTEMICNCICLKKIQLPNTLKSLNENMFTSCNTNLKIYWQGKIYTYDDLLEYETF